MMERQKDYRATRTAACNGSEAEDVAEVKVRSTRSSALDTFWTLSISGLSTRDARHGIRSDIDICTQSGTLGQPEK